eukprot:CAMPEP_0206611530 /NCGR_PEP_ID=MMETSP0325_2-20121206/55336_1 /ASSEMBLY_ACC=CAM_ASM_000347 /TAXON_ID=2866 /ORGANISM="Crypthecodinium cohnii, Strain Seligo" /LENGTH=65 /DNA_ID=CAMNT_0054130823 /DNA_START=1 /DNA_END=198 /DNA_ORIENTATION=+
MKYYVRKSGDCLFAEFGGSMNAARVSDEVTAALGSGVPLVCVHMLPEQERAYVSLDMRMKTGETA